ncbi:hypothetical protein C2G38_2190908 [Gigaspora rosea]|uniref:ATP-dependent DNA helicase n=1 Tax=Gigaspora rosea TaxID=44941 RepID=A0A397V808_9GLOM|nr:hypothetical protein C2G38_2190908 [Gigaspora rosea]
MPKRKRTYTPEQVAIRNESRRNRKSSMTEEQRVTYRKVGSEKRQPRRKRQITTKTKENINQDEQTDNEESLNKRNETSAACQLTDNDRNLLKNFRDAVADLRHNYCPIYKESFPSRMIDPEVPAELPQLSQVEEMLITQILPMFVNLRGGQLGSIDGSVSERLCAVHEAFKLETIQRQAGNSKEQQAFRNLLLCLRDGKSTENDWQLLNSRVRTLVSPTEEANLEMPFDYLQFGTTGTGARNAQSKITNGLEPVLFLSIGARPSLPTVILGKPETCSRIQFPLCLAWAITIHKSQDLTLPQAVINLGNREFALSLTFVGVSSVRTLDDLLFDSAFTFEILQKLGQHARLQQRLMEEQSLLSL